MLGDAIQKIRKRRGYGQEDVCEAVDITQSYMSMIENNKANPSMTLIEKIAKFLKVPVPVLYWFTLSESDIANNKKEAYNILKPAVDELIFSLFEEDING